MSSSDDLMVGMLSVGTGGGDIRLNVLGESGLSLPGPCLSVEGTGNARVGPIGRRMPREAIGRSHVENGMGPGFDVRRSSV